MLNNRFFIMFPHFLPRRLPRGVAFSFSSSFLRRQQAVRGKLIAPASRWKCGPRNASGHAELVFKHEVHQLQQNAVLAAEQVLKAAGGDLRLLENLQHGRAPVSVFQKQSDTSLQDPLFRLKPVASYCQLFTPLTHRFGLQTNYSRYAPVFKMGTVDISKKLSGSIA